jgi:hypothetical protein
MPGTAPGSRQTVVNETNILPVLKGLTVSQF